MLMYLKSQKIMLNNNNAKNFITKTEGNKKKINSNLQNEHKTPPKETQLEKLKKENPENKDFPDNNDVALEEENVN